MNRSRADSGFFCTFAFMGAKEKYAGVIVPLKFGETLSYSIPEGLEVEKGSWVRVQVGAHEYLGVVEDISSCPPAIGLSKVKGISETVQMPRVAETEISFWKALSEYYMCSTGEVFKALCPVSFRKQTKVRPRGRKLAEESAEAAFPLPELSQEQQKVADALKEHFGVRKPSPAFLHGVTGSGKTEIYMTLASAELDGGRSVLYLVPEIAMSRQLQERLAKVFGPRLLVFHSRLTAPQKKAVFDTLASASSSGKEQYIVLGTRSALFLPSPNLGLVIVDEEHDSSYKQEDPAPRYNGRDAAVLKASLYGAKVLLGSATPSYETLYNVAAGKYFKVELLHKFGGAAESAVKIIDTVKARRLHNMKGSFTIEALNAIRKCVASGGQVLVFRSRRAYSSAVQCEECGAVPLCPKCNVPLSYHKFNDSLVCHYCGRTIPFAPKCPQCGAEAGLALHGAGTEKIEEELREYFPEFRIARYDADTAESSREGNAILKDFADGKTDILVGTQMITKGFDFDSLALVVVVSADSLMAVDDFRADERALQTLRQFRGRAGRRSSSGKMLVQTSQADHPVFARLLQDGTGKASSAPEEALAERKMFGYPPFVRLVSIVVKDRSEGQLWHVCRDIEAILKDASLDYSGPIEPAVNFFRGMNIRQFWIKLPRNRALASTKASLGRSLDAMLLRYRHAPILTIDVDPI